MVKIYRIGIFFLFALSVIGCEPESTESEPEQAVIEMVTEDSRDTTESKTYTLYEGYVNDEKISAELHFDEKTDSISGSVLYHSSNEEFQLLGDITRGNSTIYRISEMRNSGIPQVSWYFENGTKETGFSGSWSQKGDEYISKKLSLIPAESELYLDPESLLFFENKEEAEAFFSQNKFINDKQQSKFGIVVPNDTSKKHDNLLPYGLSLYDYNEMDKFSEYDSDERFIKVAKVGWDNQIEYDNGYIKEKPGYNGAWLAKNQFCARFEHTFIHAKNLRKKYIMIRNEGTPVLVNIDELNEHGYHLEGDAFYLKSLSEQGEKLFLVNYDEETLKGQDRNIYNSPDVTSEVVLNEIIRTDGFFSVVDAVIGEDGLFWINVNYHYFTVVPCTEEVRAEKPDVKGWMKLYGDGYKSLQLEIDKIGCR